MTVPDDVVNQAERLTRLARRAVDENEAAAYRARRDELVAEYGYTARVRTDGRALGGADERGEQGDVRGVDATLVLYPSEWLTDGIVDVDGIEDTSRAVERQLSGTGSEAEWDRIEAHNRALAERIADEHGAAHGANAHAFADFMGNHYARRMETADPSEIREFLEEYYPRNAWPSDEQRDCVEQSVSLVLDAEGARPSDA